MRNHSMFFLPQQPAFMACDSACCKTILRGESQGHAVFGVAGAFPPWHRGAPGLSSRLAVARSAGETFARWELGQEASGLVALFSGKSITDLTLVIVMLGLLESIG